MPGAAVGAQHLGRHERGEHDERRDDEAVVLAVGRDDVVPRHARSSIERGDADEHDGRHVGDDGRQRTAGSWCEPGACRPRTRWALCRTRLRTAPARTEARAVVGAVAAVEDAGARLTAASVDRAVDVAVHAGLEEDVLQREPAPLQAHEAPGRASATASRIGSAEAMPSTRRRTAVGRAPSAPARRERGGELRRRRPSTSTSQPPTPARSSSSGPAATTRPSPRMTARRRPARPRRAGATTAARRCRTRCRCGG